MNKKIVINEKNYVFNSDSLELFLVENNQISDEKEENIKINCIKNDDDVLQKLVFNVSNMCNLNCKYCYASGGNYERQDSLMTKETAKRIINKVTKKYKKINVIYFFGGEPLINFKLIKYIVEELVNHYGKENLDFRTVTNGIFLNSEILEYFSRYNFKVYISLDGPRNIHEYLRGKNSYNKIIESIKYIKENKLSIRLQLSCTYTLYHQKNISLEDLEKYFKEFGVPYTINDVTTNDINLKIKDEKSKIERQKDYIDISIERILNKDDNVGISVYLSNMIDTIIFHYPQKYFCKELTNNYSSVFDYNGDEYGCLRLFGKFPKNCKEIKVQNIKDNFAKCKSCWCRNICTLCVADILLKTEKFDEKECMMPELYEYALTKLVEIMDTDEEKLSLLLNNYYAKYIK